MKMKKDRKFKTDITVGMVFLCEMEEAVEIKEAFSQREDIQLIYFTTSNGKLWIKSGDGDVKS